MFECPDCWGLGRVRSNHSEAEYDCGYCDGTGQVEVCPDCGGEGDVLGPGPDGIVPCETCAGSPAP